MPKYLVRITEDGEQYNIRSGGGGGSYTGGTGITISSDVINHSNSVTPQPTQGLYPIAIDAQGHVTSYGSAVDTSIYMVKGIDYVTAGQLSGSTLGTKATAEGIDTTASGDQSHAHGYQTVASGQNSFAGGARTQATGINSFAFGGYIANLGVSIASGHTSVALGAASTASADYSIATGYNTSASGVLSYSGGYASQASGDYSSAIGLATIANHSAQFVFGRCNIADPSTAASNAKGTYVEIVGNGANPQNRSNARTLDWDGNEVLAGKLTVGVVGTNSMDVATIGQIPTVYNASTNPNGYLTLSTLPIYNGAVV